MSSLLKKLIIALLVSGLLWAGYIFFLQPSSKDAALTASNGASGEAQAASQEMLIITQKLKSYSTNADAIVNDPRLASLNDSRVQLNPEQKGRPNPFVPVQ